jgi:hypothetical protein
LREHVIVDGVQTRVEGIDRGPLLLRTQEEWAELYRSYSHGHALFEIVSFVVITILVFVLVFSPLALLGIVLAVVVIVVALAMRASFNSMKLDLLGGGAVPGIYGMGVEMPMFPVYTSRLFIPFSEMTDAWIRSSRLGDDVLYMSVRGSRWRWRVPGRLLGEDGMAAIIDRVGSRAGMDIPDLPEETPPRLVIYTAGGASPPEVPDEP